VPRSTAKKLRERSKGRCEYSGCAEKYNLEIEHIKPRSKGGGHEISNLKLFCKTHNQRSAIKVFGKEYMAKYLK
jgi:5-methylcytosine-specific restriction endonuclease McrA